MCMGPALLRVAASMNVRQWDSPPGYGFADVACRPALS